MERYEDSIGLFGSDSGVATYGNVTCDWCGTKYTGRESDDDPDVVSDEAIRWAQFGDLEVCECCYAGVEEAVLSRIDDIIPWFIRILERKGRRLEGQRSVLASLREALNAR